MIHCRGRRGAGSRAATQVAPIVWTFRTLCYISLTGMRALGN